MGLHAINSDSMQISGSFQCVLRLLIYPARLSFLMILDDDNLPCLNFVMHPHLAEKVNLLCLVHVYLCERSGRVTGPMHTAQTTDSCVLICAV